MLSSRSADACAALERFCATSLDEYLCAEIPRPANAGERALALFHDVAASVPAYGAFLSERQVAPDSVRTLDDFVRVPQVTKENYVLRYPLAQLCRGGRVQDCDMVAVSSGSTGQPTFWPRSLADELEVAYRFEQVFRDAFRADERRTLAVVCFALGTWVGGMYTAACCRQLATKGYPITVATPGANREEILRVAVELGREFDQVVLLGYPPFLKDVVDLGLRRGIDWQSLRVKIVMAGEVFSEEWRTLMAERVGARQPCNDFASLYGTADAGVLGVETPLSIVVRRWLAAEPGAARELFGEARLPTLVQYDPFSRYFEADDRALLFTGDNGVPLVRYNILDTGGVIQYDAMLEFARARGFDPVAALSDLDAPPPRELPFVFVFGRSNFAVSYFGANVYPENVSVGLEQPQVSAWVTGKFVMRSVEDSDRNRHLAIAVELATGVSASDKRRHAIAECIRAHLLRLNSEFGAYVLPEYQTPRVELRPAGDPELFPPGVKHRYTRP